MRKGLMHCLEARKVEREKRRRDFEESTEGSSQHLMGNEI
jgi:hypothetical protein